jgi:hypothetical protein
LTPKNTENRGSCCRVFEPAGASRSIPPLETTASPKKVKNREVHAFNGSLNRLQLEKGKRGERGVRKLKPLIEVINLIKLGVK